MEHLSTEELSKRVAELERLAWSLFRSLETYVTFNAIPTAEIPPEQEDKAHGA